MRIVVLLVMFLILENQAMAFYRIFTGPCAKAGIPKNLVMAIARQESSLHPWCVNVQGKDFVPKTYADAVKIIRKAHKAGQSYDVGLMQINCQWTRLWKINPLDLLDPKTNIKLGIYILRQEIRRHGLNWKAVGKYHSPDPERGRKYAWRVYKKLGGKIETKTAVAARATEKKHPQGICYGSGIWRNSGIQPKGRLITFRIREEGMPWKQNSEQGRRAGEAGTFESKR